jgi:anthocyanidin reductase
MATGSVPMVHIADLCRAEMFVAEEEAAAAGRYICCSVNTTVAEIARFLGDKYPQYSVKTNLLYGGTASYIYSALNSDAFLLR